MNRLACNIAKVCAENVVKRKLLIAPSRRVGNQWLQTVVRSGLTVVNVEIHTVSSLAMEVLGPDIIALDSGKTLVSDRAAMLLVDQIWSKKIRHDEAGYLFSLNANTSLSQAVYHTIRAMRLAGLGPGDISAGAFEVGLKGREIRLVLERYTRELELLGKIDRAGLFKRAAEKLRQKPDSLIGDPLVLLPEDMSMVACEKEFFRAIPSQNKCQLEVDRPENTSADEKLTDARLLRWATQPDDAPQPVGDGTADIFQAVGAVNEVREVLRRCLAEGIALDDVELLYTDSQTYLPLIYEIFQGLLVVGDDSTGGGVTFAEGIGVGYSRPGRLLAGWLRWIREDYPQAVFAQIIQDGLLEIPDNESGHSFARLANTLRIVSIGFGRVRYIPKIDERIATCKAIVESALQVNETAEKPSHRRKTALRNCEELFVLRNLLEKLLICLPPEGARQREILKSAREFLETFARRENELDNLACIRMVEEIDDLLDILAEDGSFEAIEFLDQLARQTRVGGSGPQPGCLHAAKMLSGGHSGRGNTFIVGLNDHLFPGAGLQDPILLDGERRKISQELPTAADRLQEKTDDFARLLARLVGNVTLSFSCTNIADGRDEFPSSAILGAYRILSGNHLTADQSDMLRQLDGAVSFVPQNPEKSLDESEWWLWRTCSAGSIEDPQAVLAERYPHLGRGLIAAERRDSEELTVYDGLVEEAGRDFSPCADTGPIFSASGLETLGNCPLSYFFKYILRIETADQSDLDSDQWLDAMQNGSLLHDVFYDFMRQLLGDDKLPPVYERDYNQLNDILQRHIEKYKRISPPPSEDALTRRLRQLRQSIHIFLTEEAEFCKTRKPEFLEASIGLPSFGETAKMDSPEPVSITLPDGSKIRLRGRIDRVDRVMDPGSGDEFEVWDYKTGSDWKYRQSPPFNQGRVLQHLVYLHLAGHRLGEMFPAASIARVGYYLPTHKGRGMRIAYTPDELADGKKVMGNLCKIVSSGAFLSTNKTDDCTFCDYVQICGDISGVTASAENKLLRLNGPSELLAPQRELRGLAHE